MLAFASRTGRKLQKFYRLNFTGALIGFLGYLAALTPSLMPRPAAFMGIIAGFGFVIGYGLGVLASYFIRSLHFMEPSKPSKRIAWNVLFASMSVVAIVYGFAAAAWQNDVRLLVGEQALKGTEIADVVLFAILSASLVLALSRIIRLGSNAIKQLIFKVPRIHRRLATLFSVVVAGGLIILIFNSVILNGFLTLANRVYSSANQGTASGIAQPTSSLRSGATGSAVSWQELGRQGRNFVGGGPTTQQIAQFNGAPALQPIRVYAGIDSADTIQKRADLVVQELERTGAFNRKVLVVMTATGSGWIEPQSADSIEYMYGGNSALASIQYSYLPSWITLIAGRKDATDAGKALYEAVYSRWNQLPPNARPRLIAYGLSLGSFGSQSNFSGANDLAARTNGALFLGTPSFSNPWLEFTNSRDSSSPEIMPVYKSGNIVRFTATNSDIIAAEKNWPSASRTLYVQHPSDPVVWWSPDLIFHKPDWLKEPRGYDVSSSVHWYPFITFLQVTIDQFFGTSVPNGHGHNYANTIVNAWTAVANPGGTWNSAKAMQLQTIIDNYPNE